MTHFLLLPNFLKTMHVKCVLLMQHEPPLRHLSTQLGQESALSWLLLLRLASECIRGGNIFWTWMRFRKRTGSCCTYSSAAGWGPWRNAFFEVQISIFSEAGGRSEDNVFHKHKGTRARCRQNLGWRIDLCSLVCTKVSWALLWRFIFLWLATWSRL